jgi:hypothetical protein
MQHGYSACLNRMSIPHVPDACPCCISKRHVHAAVLAAGPCFMSLLHVHASCPCCRSMLACPCCMSTRQVHVAAPRRMSLMQVSAACPYIQGSIFEWKNHVPFFQGKIFPKYGQNCVKQSKWTCNARKWPHCKGK